MKTYTRPFLSLAVSLAALSACSDDGNSITSDTLLTSTSPTVATNNPPTSDPPTSTDPPTSSTTDSGGTVGTMTQATTENQPTSTTATSTTAVTATETGPDPSASSSSTSPSDPSASSSSTEPPGTTTTTTDPSSTSTTSDGTTTSDDTTTGGPPPFAGIPETCEQAELSKSTVGCQFYAVDMDSHDLAENLPYAVGIANVQLNKVANITIERKQGNVWNVVAGPAQIPALNLGSYMLTDQHTDDSQLAAGFAYRVKSDVPVIAYQFNPVNGQNSFLTDHSMLYPVTAYDYVNHAVMYRGAIQDNTGTPQHSYATAVAWKDGTTITVTPKVATDGGNGVPAGQANVPYQVVLNEGDVLSVAVQNLADAITGTIFESDENHPFGLLVGIECSLIPAAGNEGTCCCDHVEEMISGVRLWGKNFIASRMPVRRPATPEPSLWQLYGAEDNTTVNLVADPQVTGLPPNPIKLNKGQVIEFYASGPTNEPGDFEVNSDKPVAVMNYMVGSQYMGGPEMPGDPAAVQIPPYEQFLPRYVVLVPPSWNNDVGVIVRQAGSTITLDGVAIADNNFNPVGNSGFEVARVALGDGVHVLDGDMDPFSIIVVGYDQYDSYAYLGGTGTAIINPDPQ